METPDDVRPIMPAWPKLTLHWPCAVALIAHMFIINTRWCVLRCTLACPPSSAADHHHRCPSALQPARRASSATQQRLQMTPVIQPVCSRSLRTLASLQCTSTPASTVTWLALPSASARPPTWPSPSTRLARSPRPARALPPGPTGQGWQPWAEARAVDCASVWTGHQLGCIMCIVGWMMALVAQLAGLVPARAMYICSCAAVT